MDLGPRLIVLIIQYSHQMAVAKPPIQQFQLNNATPTNTQVAHSPLPAVRAAPLVLVPEPPEAAPEPTTMTPVVAFPSVTTGTFPTVYRGTAREWRRGRKEWKMMERVAAGWEEWWLSSV
jgi:hypothetical protein